MHIATQLALFVENRPGMLARVCDALSEAKINIYALAISDTVVVDTEVLLIEADNKPGTLTKIATKLGDSGVNIEYCYFATRPDSKKGLLVIRVSEPKKALKILNTR
jgi:hypothetical protein